MQFLATGLIKKSWIVFLHAVLISLESIAIELLTVRVGIPPLVLAAVGIPIAGLTLLWVEWHRSRAAKRTGEPGGKDRPFAVFRSYRRLMSGSALLALGLFTWYDSIDRVGAAKESLIAGPLETVFILFLARLFLRERLKRVQLVGAAVAVAGFFLTVASGGPGSVLSRLSLGDVEAIISAASFACGIIVITRLTEHYSPVGVTSSILVVSGLILLAAVPLSYSLGLGWVDSLSAGAITGPGNYQTWAASILLFSLLPLSAAFTYVTGLARIGASLTSTIASFSIIVILVIQLGQRSLGFLVILPESISLAVAGGVLAVLGIFLIHVPPRHRDAATSADHLSRPPV